MTAIVAIIMIAVGIIAFSALYGIIKTSYETLWEKMLIFELDTLLSGISVRVKIPYPLVQVDYNYTVNIVYLANTTNITLSIHNVLAYQSNAFSNGKCTAYIRPWLKMGSACINITFYNITCTDIKKCLSQNTNTCIIRIYSLWSGIGLEGYIRATTRTIVFFGGTVNITSDYLSLCGLKDEVTLRNKTIIIEVIFYKQETS